ncbi:MAG: tryptophan 7-halogenase [Silicimonas sp.]|nr:tryptophan 7-halogenase [Silicimonas sp.]
MDAETRSPALFDRAIVLGAGYSARLAAIALDPVLPVTHMIGPDSDPDPETVPHGLTGQAAHSHIFLPRMEQELQRIDPRILPAFGRAGYHFRPGSNRLAKSGAAATHRMFATRWQVDGLLGRFFNEHFSVERVSDRVADLHESDDGPFLELEGGTRFEIPPRSLVVDASGARSPIIAKYLQQTDTAINEPGNVSYITQFFRLRDHDWSRLPDPLFDCAHDFGSAYTMLYPAGEGWFSVSIAVSTQSKPLIVKLRETDGFETFCRQNPAIAAWIDAARAVGPSRIFVNPRNRWNVPILEAGVAPEIYFAVGDALTSMLPTFGANCSFAATHIRVLRDVLAEGHEAAQKRVAAGIRNEQQAFFEKTLGHAREPREFVSYAASPRNKPAKKLKRKLRRLLGLDKNRIARHLIETSSL